MDITTSSNSQARYASSSYHSNRRRSLPALSTKRSGAKTGRTSINHLNPEAASPEVISSLISSLSAISLPASHHFEEEIPAGVASQSTPTSPNAFRTTFAGSRPYHQHRAPPSPRVHRSLRLGTDAETYHHDLVEFLHPDDAATPPVIRTSRRSSAQLSAEGVLWNGVDSTNYWKRYISAGGPSNRREQEDEHVDPLDTRRGSIKASAGGTDLRKVGRIQKGLIYISSKERLREEENKRLGGKITIEKGNENNTLIPVRDSSVGKGSSSNFPINRHQNVTDRPGKEANKPAFQDRPRFLARTDKDVTEEGDNNRDDTRKNKPGKKHPPVLVMSEHVNKSRSPVGSPTIIRSKTSPEISGEPSSEKQKPVENEWSAPSPAIPRAKDRDGSSNRVNGNSPLKQRSASPSANTSGDTQRLAASSSSPKRKNSRLKRRSQPFETRSGHRHHRSFSNPLRRSSPTPSAPQIVADDRVSRADSIEDAVDAYLCSPRLSQKIRHPETGRVISFSEVGDSEGFAVFCCVGMGLSRYITAIYDELALTLRLRLITPDRPGVGESEPCPDGTGTPLGWPDDVYAICQALNITKFSILAHSAGAIYALATALRMPQHIRGRIHLLAPWIPPSQLSSIGNGGPGSKHESPPAGSVPRSQRILRALPTSLFKVANSNFMSSTSSSLTSSLPRSPRRRRKNNPTSTASPSSSKDKDKDNSPDQPRDSLMYPAPSEPNNLLTTPARQQSYDTRLAHSIWSLSTTNANPAIDLLVCLERRQPIGFRYVDITRPSIVIHHGSRDTRVPLENVKWLAKTMRKCEVRVLEGEGHGLMASAQVMGSVLVEISKEWEDWDRVVRSTGAATTSGGTARDDRGEQ